MRDRDSQVIDNLLSLVNRFQLQENLADPWKWRASTDASFKTKKMYDILSSEAAATPSEPTTCRFLHRIWSKLSLIKSSAMAWRLLQDRLPTRVNLATRHILPQSGTASCLLCDSASESANHLFFGCCVSLKIWTTCFKWLDISTTPHFKTSRNFMAFSGQLLGKKR